ncbi:MAG: OmpA family protein [Aliarcobacter sp.]|jgi:outer membrane protein OmpA-like peptidoglycan-associated protein|nr:OmpA family protein [Aliarcobacter sp.]
MTLLRKIIMLLIFFLILNIFTIYGFEYKDFLSNNNASLNEQKINLNTTNEKQEAKPFNLVLVKKDGVVEMNGLFSNENDVKMISDILNINRQGEYKYEENRVVNEELLKELVVLITPFKDFFADNSKLTVLNNEVTLLGELKDANYKTLLDSIISRSKINIKTDITIPGVSNIADNKEINNPTSNINEVQLLINNILSAKKINFERRSTAITAESKTVVEEIAKILNDNPTLKVEISGHTDSRGSDSLNKKISQDRASSVRDILISLGINKDRVTAIGYGEEKPLVKDDENGLSEINRRVEFNILGENK